MTDWNKIAAHIQNLTGQACQPRAIQELGGGCINRAVVLADDARAYFVKLNSVSPNLDSKQRQTAITGDYEFWYELVGFTATSAFTEGVDLINGTIAALGDPTITDLTGLFVTKAAGVSGTNVSTGYKLGNACTTAVQ